MHHQVFWAIRRRGSLVEARPWVFDHVIGWRAQAAFLLAATEVGARALLPAGKRFEYSSDAEWWSVPRAAA